MKVEADTVIVPNWEQYLVGGHSRGPEEAAVTILEFGDYECPFCVRFDATLKKILAAYPTQVRFVYRHWPLTNHRFAYPAARAAECAADQERFWPLHDVLFQKNDSLGLVSFAEFGQLAGVENMEEFQACIRRTDAVPVIDAGAKDAQAIGGRGTPTLIVNGLLMSGGVDSAYIARLVADAAKK